MGKLLICALMVPILAFCRETVSKDQAIFNAADAGVWQEVFSDDGTGDWHDKWFLDGEIGSVENFPDGMQLTAGPRFGNDAHHMVLWTKESFEGDLKIEYDFTRLDFETRAVCILYIEATGSGDGPYAKDITKWNELRKVPAMRMYFDHMNLYHISFAAFPNDEDTTQYIRGRRYMPETGNALTGTDFKPDYYPTGLFGPGILHHVTVIKKGQTMLMRIANQEQTFYCCMSNPDLPPVIEGRIGLRQMYTRSARYRNFRVYQSQ
ncbi:MAG: DUF1961 family protein [Kiritimatiellales bacterium]